MIVPKQIKAARAFLGLNQDELARAAGIGSATLKRVEATEQVTGAAKTIWKIEQALEKAGIEFIAASDGKGAGVRLRRG